ncbi:MAG: response regulator [Phycisphaerales bacterium]
MSCNVLVVDDSSILRQAIRKIVEVASVPKERIFEAGNGAEALQVLDREWIDLILLDLNMPVMDGEQFARELRTRPECKDVTVVVVSTEVNQERLDRLKQLGVAENLRKPFEPERLRKIISRVIGVKA